MTKMEQMECKVMVPYGVHVSLDAATDGVQVPSVQGDAAASDG
jgi:hypothetical protein